MLVGGPRCEERLDLGLREGLEKEVCWRRGSSYNPSDFRRNLRHSLKTLDHFPQPGSQAHPHPPWLG